MAFKNTRKCCGISWRRTPSRRWSWMFGLCETKCLLWSWGIVKMWRNTHQRSKGIWMTSMSVRRVRLVQCQREITATTWCSVYLRMMIGGLSPSWWTIKSTPWPINLTRWSESWNTTKHLYSRKTIRRWQPYSQCCRPRVTNGSRLGRSGSPMIFIVRGMVVVRRVRSIAGESGRIPRNATDTIRWETLHCIVPALPQWRAEHRQRQRQRQWQRQRQQRRWQHKIKTIGWQLRAEKAHGKRAGTWSVLPHLTCAEIGKSSYCTHSTAKEMTRKFTTWLEGLLVRPSDTETCNWGFCWQDAGEIKRLLWETSCRLKENTTCFPNCGICIVNCGLSQSMAMGSRYTTKRQQRVPVEVEEVLRAWHARLECYSRLMWRLQERGIEREPNCFRGSSAKLYFCFLYSLALTVMIPPWRSVAMNFSVVIKWVSLGLREAEPHEL